MEDVETLPGFCHVLHLGCPDLVMNLSKGLAIGGSDNVGNDFRVSSHVTLNRGIHVHLIKQDEVFAAFAIGLHGFVLIDGFCQADSEERRERQDSPVVALCSRRNARARVTSTSSKPWIMGLYWTDRYASASRRRIFGYGTTWEAACWCFMVFLLPSDGRDKTFRLWFPPRRAIIGDRPFPEGVSCMDRTPDLSRVDRRQCFLVVLWETRSFGPRTWKGDVSPSERYKAVRSARSLGSSR